MDYDKAYDEKFKKGQVELVIRFCVRTFKQLTWYLPLSVVGHSVAKDMKSFLDASSEMKLSNLLQILMVGPSVSWSFLE